MLCLPKTICIALLLEFSSMAGWAATPSKEDKPQIPSDLYHEFKAVPADENAIIVWCRVAEVIFPLSDKEKQIIKYCWSPTAKEPSSDELNKLESWLNRNKEALELFNTSLNKLKAQWPSRNSQDLQPELKSLPLMIRARLFEADQMAEQNKFTAAAKSLEDSLKMAQTGIESDATILNYLVACNARTLVQDAILRLAYRKKTSVSLLEDFLKILPRLDSETNAYAHVLRVEFTREYHDSLDLKKLTENLSKMSGTNATLYLSFYPDDLQRAFKVLLDPSLVPLHPKPFDAKAEIETSIRHYRIYRTNSLAPWSERNGEVELEHEEAHTNLVQDIVSLMELVQNDSLPLSQQAAQKARIAYGKIKNPIGRIFGASIIGFMASDLKVCQVRTEREATRTCLALIIFERQKGQLPATLSELVQAKILKSVPVDPFCGEPLHYSRETRKIWSVSNDGEDDDGESGKIRWFEKDAVWEIPQIN